MRVAPKVLLADATWFGTLAAARDLAKHGVFVTLASDSWSAPARWSRYVSKVVSSPSSKDVSAFLAWLLRFGAEQPGTVLYPTSDEIAWLVASHREEISRYYTLYSPPITSLINILDKARLTENAKKAGLDVPDEIMPHNEAEVEQCARTASFPLYVKPRGQMFGLGVGKGVRVDNPSELMTAWRKQVATVTYDPEVTRHIPEVNLPVLQRCICGGGRIYTVDGFIDKTGDLSAMLACVKILQRPRGSGPGIIFEHAEMDADIEQGLHRLFRTLGFHGVFDAEFLEVGSRKLLIDINPRFYNHMAFEIERGLHLPWLTYLAATGDLEALKTEIATGRLASAQRRAYVHRLSLGLLFRAQRLAGRMSAADEQAWRRRIAAYGNAITDPVWAAGDDKPVFAEMAMELVSAARHPRSYFRGLLKS